MGLSLHVGRFWRSCSLLALAEAGLGAVSPAKAAHKLVFYDPGANQYDLQGFSGAFSRFLKQGDTGLTFQLVRGANVLSGMLRDEPVSFVMVPSEFLQTHGKALNLAPLMVPTLGGEAYSRKVLVDSGQAA